MKTLTVSARRVNKAAPVRSTVVPFDGGRCHAVREFGRGILPSRPAYLMPFTAADAAWAAQAFADRDAAYDRHVEGLAQEAEWADALCRGFRPC